jgi:hypothetical protein
LWQKLETAAMRPALFGLFALLALPATAQETDLGVPMSGAEFEAYVTGRTLTYADQGVIYGTEEYRKDRKVRWAFTKDECRLGYWYEAGEQICFVYEDPNDPQCWLFFKGAKGLQAQFMGVGGGASLSEVEQSAGPMSCAGPDVGV